MYASVLDRSIVSIGPSRVGLVPHSDLKDLIESSRQLAQIFWRETINESSILREWICNVAARGALASIAHLLCELAFRLDAVGLAADDRFHLPLTQQDVANASGLSVVHVNRTLKELQRRQLLVWEGRSVSILNHEGLKNVAEFQTTYLRTDKP